MEFYKFADQQAKDTMVNWADVSKGVIDMLDKEKEIREAKKKEIDEAFRGDIKQLNEAPLGKFQDGNEFISDYSNAATQTALMDSRLLKSGQMDLKTYTYRRQNRLDGTNALFGLQKAYQESKQAVMDGMQSGKYAKAANAYQYGLIEKMGDLSKARGIIDQTTSAVNIGIMEPNKKTGIMELTKNVMPVSVAKRLIVNPIAAFDLDGKIDQLAKTSGVDIASLISASTTTKSGELIKAEGLWKLSEAGGLDRFKGTPEYEDLKKSVALADKSITQAINSEVVDPAVVLSVVTDHAGYFDSKSLTSNVDEVKADPKHKILMVVDPETGTLVMDKNAPNYDNVKKMAVDFLKTEYLRRNSTKIEASIVPQLHELQQKIPREPSVANLRDKDEKEQAKFIGDGMINFVTGDDATSNAGANILSDLLGNAKFSRPKGTDTIVVEQGDNVTTINTKGLSAEKIYQQIAAKFNVVKNANLDKIMKYTLGVEGSGNISIPTENVESKTTADALEKKYKETVNNVGNQIKPETWEGNKTALSAELNKKFAPMGLSFEKSTQVFGIGGNEIEIYRTESNGTKKKITSVPPSDVLDYIKKMGNLRQWELPIEFKKVTETAAPAGGNGGKPDINTNPDKYTQKPQ